MYTPASKPKARNRIPINIHQDSFAKAYISTIANSRRPQDSLSDMTNMELVEDNIVRPRPPLVRYGIQPANPVIGRGKYRYNGVRGELFMMNVAGVGKIYYRTNGGAFTLVGGLNTYDSTAWAGFCQSKNRIYVYNGVNNLSYIDLTSFITVEYTSLATPSAPTTVAAAGLTSGTKPYNYYYKVTANNVVGESAASAASTAVAVNAIRDNWNATNSVTVSWSVVAGATSYTIYGGDDPNFLNEIITLANLATLSYIDDGTLTLNPFKIAPSSNSTQGAVFTWMYVDARNAQIFGITASNQLYYSAPGTTSAADFSSLNGGGFTTIDEGGDTVLNFVDGFRTGKGDPVITTSSRGSAGKGKLCHITFDSANYGDQVIFFPDVTEANGQSGTYAPRATVKSGDSLTYPTGDAFKSTGTSQNIVNILTTNSISQDIEPDVNKINLTALKDAAGVEYQGRLYFALPVSSTTNNEIWILDTTRKNAWILRWTVAAKDIWLYEDSSGTSHLCVLVNNVILEFTRTGATLHTDDGVPFRSRVAYSSLVWDPDGLSLGNIHNQYAKLLDPRGSIQFNTYGLSKRGQTTNTGSDNYAIETTFTGIGQWNYSGNYKYGDDPGTIGTFADSVAVLKVRPKGLLNQEDWELVAETAGTDYLLSAVNTRGVANLDLIYKGSS
jgi:hypothetical protein